MTDKKQSRIRVARQCTMIFGALVLIIGLFSYFESIIARKFYVDIGSGAEGKESYVRFDKYCEIMMEQYPDRFDNLKSCPNLSLELYFISAVIICFIISWLGLLASGLADLRKLKFLEAGCYLVAAALMLTAGIVYIIFAGQVRATLGAFNNGYDDYPIDQDNVAKITEKRVAGALAILQALQFGCAAVLVGLQ